MTRISINRTNGGQVYAISEKMLEHLQAQAFERTVGSNAPLLKDAPYVLVDGTAFLIIHLTNLETIEYEP